MKVISTKPLPERGKGWALLRIQNCLLTTDGCILVIERKMHAKPFLAFSGWQVSEARLPLETRLEADETIGVILPPQIVKHLDGANYQIHLFDTDSKLIGETIIRWQGVTYRGVNQTINLVNPPPPLGLAPRETESGFSGATPEKVISPIEPMSKPTPRITQHVDGWADDHSPILDGHESTLPTPTDFDSTPVPPLNEFSTEPKQQTEYPVFRNVGLITCYQCKSKIFLGVKRCPFCNANYN